MTPVKLAPRVPLADRIARHRNSRRDEVSSERGIFDVLMRRRQTEHAPPDLLDAFTRVTELQGTMELDDLRDASIELAVAAMAIVVCIPPREHSRRIEDH